MSKPISLKKLKEFLEKKGYIIYKYYNENNLCKFIEVVSTRNSLYFLVYIPSNYRFGLKYNEGYRLHSVTANSLSKNGICESPDASQIDNIYTEIEAPESITASEDIPKKLEEKYNCPIELKKFGNKQMGYLKDLDRQTSRLKHCTQNTNYSIAIFYQGFLYISGDDHGYYVENYPQTDKRKMLLVIDITLLYEKISTIGEEIFQMTQGIHNILGKNQQTLYDTIQLMLDKLASYSLTNITPDKLDDKLNSFEKNIEGSSTGLVSLRQKEGDIIKRMKELSIQNTKGIHNDIDRVTHKKKLEEQLSELDKQKENNLKVVFSSKENIDNLLLATDKIYFDSILLLDELTKNFQLAENLS